MKKSNVLIRRIAAWSFLIIMLSFWVDHSIHHLVHSHGEHRHNGCKADGSGVVAHIHQTDEHGECTLLCTAFFVFDQPAQSWFDIIDKVKTLSTQGVWAYNECCIEYVGSYLCRGPPSSSPIS
jgi:hypothetical protein